MGKIIVPDTDGRVTRWVAERVGMHGQWTEPRGIGLERDGELVAGVVVEGYVKDTRCTMNVAGVGGDWLNRDFLWFCFHYVFEQLACRAAVALVSSANNAALRFDSHIGFKPAGRIADGASDGDLVILAMHKDECRWLTRGRRT